MPDLATPALQKLPCGFQPKSVTFFAPFQKQKEASQTLFRAAHCLLLTVSLLRQAKSSQRDLTQETMGAWQSFSNL